MRKCEAKRTLLNYFLLPTTPVFKRRRDLTKSLGSFEFFLRAARLDLAIFDEDLRRGSFILWSCSRISYKVQQGDAGRQGLQWLPCLTKLVTGGEVMTHHLRVPATTWWSLVPDCRYRMQEFMWGTHSASHFCISVCLFVCFFVCLFVRACVRAFAESVHAWEL